MTSASVGALHVSCFRVSHYNPSRMNLIVLIILLAACVLMFVLERTGVPTTLELHFKGDIKRESRWLAQYGQSVCTPVAALLLWRLDPDPKLKPLLVIACVVATSIACML